VPYGTLRETPYPDQSELVVRPHPWLPNVYTVPFLDGRLIYAVLEGPEVGLDRSGRSRWAFESHLLRVIDQRFRAARRRLACVSPLPLMSGGWSDYMGWILEQTKQPRR
jgi:hypothetical protein